MKAKLKFIPAAAHVTSTIKEEECVVFTHIPKAAGTTLDRLLKGVGIVANLPWHRAFGTVYYQFLGKGKRESLDSFLEWPQSLKNDVRIVTGHVPFGLHEHLAHRARYVTLLREPIARTISHFKMGVSRGGWDGNEPLSEVFRKGGLVSDVQVRMLAGITSPHKKLDQSDLDKALHNLEEYYFLVGFSDTFDSFTSALLGYLQGPDALLGEEQSARIKLSNEREQNLKSESEAYNHWDMILYEKSRTIADQKILELVKPDVRTMPKETNNKTLIASSQIKFNKSEYSVIPPDQFVPVINKLMKKGVEIEGL